MNIKEKCEEMIREASNGNDIDKVVIRGELKKWGGAKCGTHTAFQAGFVFALETVVKLMEEKEKNNNPCKYCGDDNNSSDENLLCEDCRMIFGHTYYNEL